MEYDYLKSGDYTDRRLKIVKKKPKYLLILVSFVQEQSKVNISPTLEHCSSAQSEFPFLSIFFVTFWHAVLSDDE